MIYKLYLLFFISLILSESCVDPIDFDVERGEVDLIVIDGRVVESLDEDLNFAEVNVQRVFNFSSASRSTISVELVTLSNGIQTIELQQIGLGAYGLSFDQSAYDLSDDLQHIIYVKTLDGREFESQPVTKEPVPEPDDINVEIVPTAVFDSLGISTVVDQAVISLSTPVFETENNSLLWEVEATYQVSTTQIRKCYVSESVFSDQILTLDTRDLSVNRLDNQEIIRTPVSKKFREGIYFNIRQYSLDQGASEYFRNINSLLVQPSTIFNNPLNKLQSNIVNINDPDKDVFGYFYATQATDTRIKVDSIRPYCNRTPPQGNDSEADCGLDPRTNRPATGSDPLCCDCRTVPGVTTVRPYYWE